MSTPENTTPPATPPATPAMPTPDDANAVIAAAQQAAQRATTAAEQAEAAHAAAGREATTRFPDLPAEVVKQISDAAAGAVLAGLRAEFEVKPPDTTTPPAAAGETPAPPAETPPADQRPKSIAQRILGQ